MNRDVPPSPGAPTPSPAGSNEPTRASALLENALAPRQWRQIALLTAGALALHAGFRALPTGTNLSHGDFRTGGAPGALEMCDPANPQFIPVVARRSPVAMAVGAGTHAPGLVGQNARVVVTLATASGKPIAPPDLLVVHTRKLHLLLVDPTLEDYQHVHPEPGARAGEWVFAFTPQRAGVYRVFADFTPAATARSLYASADLEIGAAPVEAALRRDSDASTSDFETSMHDSENGGRRSVAAVGDAGGQVFNGRGGDGAPPITAENKTAVLPVAENRGVKPLLQPQPTATFTQRRGDFVFTLTPAELPLRAGRPAELAFTITRADGGAVPLAPVMDAYAHLVAFDEARSGFAHLHPDESELAQSPDARAPRLTFKITIPRAGRYVIWAQVNLDGAETFAPFWLEVG
jgi:hypothetical protein